LFRQSGIVKLLIYWIFFCKLWSVPLIKLKFCDWRHKPLKGAFKAWWYTWWLIHLLYIFHLNLFNHVRTYSTTVCTIHTDFYYLCVLSYLSINVHISYCTSVHLSAICYLRFICHVSSYLLYVTKSLFIAIQSILCKFLSSPIFLFCYLSVACISICPPSISSFLSILIYWSILCSLSILIYCDLSVYTLLSTYVSWAILICSYILYSLSILIYVSSNTHLNSHDTVLLNYKNPPLNGIYSCYL